MYPLLLSLHSYSDWALLVLRLVLAAIFFVHGHGKWSQWKPPAAGAPKNPMSGIMKLLSICEPLGALAMVTGFLTQIAALGFCVIMIGAMYLKITKWKLPFWAKDNTGWEFDLLILASSLLIFSLGAGRFSVDSFLGGLDVSGVFS
jgi:uncharacterized membrane protein YphA (DoxX/SURF4 family)